MTTKIFDWFIAEQKLPRLTLDMWSWDSRLLTVQNFIDRVYGGLFQNSGMANQPERDLNL